MAGPVAVPSRYDSSNGSMEPHQIKRGGGGGKGTLSRLHTNQFPYHDCAVEIPTIRQHSASVPFYGLTRYIRRFWENVAGQAMFTPTAEIINTTLNRRDPSPRPLSPIPHNRKWRISTYYPKFDSRTNTVYWPKEAVQFPSRNYTAGTLSQQAKIRGSYFPMLTQYRRYPPYSESTKTLGR
jgi:hypothetical protein